MTTPDIERKCIKAMIIGNLFIPIGFVLQIMIIIITWIIINNKEFETSFSGLGYFMMGFIISLFVFCCCFETSRLINILALRLLGKSTHDVAIRKNVKTPFVVLQASYILLIIAIILTVIVAIYPLDENLPAWGNPLAETFISIPIFYISASIFLLKSRRSSKIGPVFILVLSIIFLIAPIIYAIITREIEDFLVMYMFVGTLITPLLVVMSIIILLSLRKYLKGIDEGRDRHVGP